MSILENLKPAKEIKTFEITAYSEDMTLFINALDYLQAKYKGGGKFTQEALFEHLSSPLREDKKLMEYNEGHPKRKGRGSRSKGRDEKKKEAMQ